jgi:hypothetical protein
MPTANFAVPVQDVADPVLSTISFMSGIHHVLVGTGSIIVYAAVVESPTNLAMDVT